MESSLAKVEGEEAWRRLGGFLVDSGSGVCICGRVKDEWGGGEARAGVPPLQASRHSSGRGTEGRVRDDV